MVAQGCPSEQCCPGQDRRRGWSEESLTLEVLLSSFQVSSVVLLAQGRDVHLKDLCHARHCIYPYTRRTRGPQCIQSFRFCEILREGAHMRYVFSSSQNRQESLSRDAGIGVSRRCSSRESVGLQPKQAMKHLLGMRAFKIFWALG